MLLSTPTSTNTIYENVFLLVWKSLFLNTSKGKKVCFNVMINDLITHPQSIGKKIEIIGELISA